MLHSLPTRSGEKTHTRTAHKSMSRILALITKERPATVEVLWVPALGYSRIQFSLTMGKIKTTQFPKPPNGKERERERERKRERERERKKSLQESRLPCQLAGDEGRFSLGEILGRGDVVAGHQVLVGTRCWQLLVLDFGFGHVVISGVEVLLPFLQPLH
uniref:Uncharacterized protein n=1 Tax=Micrurus spixii TaxID=129469 RepID=A0A2D4LH14_9SAUR